MKPSLCLLLRVDRPVAGLARYLQSIRANFDHWLISSEPSVKHTIVEVMQGIPGHWCSSAEPKPDHLIECQQQLRSNIEYFLWLEPEMIFSMTVSSFNIRFTHDIGWLPFGETPTQYLPRLVSSKVDFQFSDEYLQKLCLQDKVSYAKLDVFQLSGASFAPWVSHLQDQSRASVSIRRAEYLYQKNEISVAKALFSELISECGETGWLARFRLLQIRQREGEDTVSLIRAYKTLLEDSPLHRAEPMLELAKLYRLQSDFKMALDCANQAAELSLPKLDCLAIERAAYDYEAAVERTVCHYFLGEHPLAVAAANEALTSSMLPQALRGQIIDNRRISLDIMFPPLKSPARQQNNIKIISTFRNAGAYLSECIDSILVQDYPDFEAIFIDDASDDAPEKHIPLDDPRFKLIRNKTRCGALFGHVQAVQQYCDSTDIIVRLDGDDLLACDDALSYINQFYNQQNCDVMIGQSHGKFGSGGFARPFVSEEDLSRNAQNISFKSPVHILTYRAGLMHRYRANIKVDEDHFIDDGKWLMAATDTALCAVLFQLAGFHKTRYNDKILYRYRENNPQSENAGYRQAQKETCRLLAEKPKLRCIYED